MKLDKDERDALRELMSLPKGETMAIIKELAEAFLAEQVRLGKIVTGTDEDGTPCFCRVDPN
jgi:hypothetical protein